VAASNRRGSANVALLGESGVLLDVDVVEDLRGLGRHLQTAGAKRSANLSVVRLRLLR
jgi:hypothetical protein